MEIINTMSVFETKYLYTQYGLIISQTLLLLITIFFYRQLVYNDNQREKRAIENTIKHWCKCVFKSVDSPGALQRAGSKCRNRFPNHINLILIAYDELSVEHPSRDTPALYKFLESMEGIEKGKWPSSADVFAGHLDIYNL